MKKKLIIVKVKGGLGNQLFQYAAALRFRADAAASVFLDISDFKSDPFGRIFQLHHFDITVPVLSHYGAVALRSWRRLGACLPERLRYASHLWVDDESGETFPESPQSAIQIFDGYWQSAKFVEPILSEFRQHIRLSEASMSAGFIHWSREIANSDRPTAIHIRRGDFASNSVVNKVHGCCSAEYYLSACRDLLERDRARSFFVFTDDAAWAQANLTGQRGMRFVSSEAGMRDFEEFVLMSKCRDFVISNSTFSWWAAKLNESDDTRVIAPLTWFAGRTEPANLIPENWLRI